jgi:hypothetical protein
MQTTKPTYDELVMSLKMAQRVLGNNWFVSNGEEEFNNYDVIEADKAIQALLARISEKV